MLVMVTTWSLIKFATTRTKLILYCVLFHLAAQTMGVCYNIHIEERNAQGSMLKVIPVDSALVI